MSRRDTPSLRLAFDPVTREFILDLDSESIPPVTIQLDEIVFTYYHNAAIIRFLMTPGGIDVVLVPVSDPTLTLVMTPSGNHRWSVHLEPA
ncbi:hypothetical protein D3C87_1113750 [compost metagenome]